MSDGQVSGHFPSDGSLVYVNSSFAEKYSQREKENIVEITDKVFVIFPLFRIVSLLCFLWICFSFDGHEREIRMGQKGPL
jgi:hypothetical protein